MLFRSPTVSGHVRVVAIGEDEMVACGGTHPSTAGQLGLVKILGVTPARGKMRVSVIAGKRALRDYQAMYDRAHEAAALLSTSTDNLAAHVAAMQEALKQAEFELNHMRRDAALAGLEDMMDAAPRTPEGAAVIARMLEGDANLVKEAASHLIRRLGVIALLGANVGEGRATFVFACSQDVEIHMGQLLSRAAKPLGGKGGGRPD